MKTFVEKEFFKNLKKNEYLTIVRFWDLKRPGLDDKFIEEYENGSLYKWEFAKKYNYGFYYFYQNKYSELNTCKICGRTSTKKNVTYRSFLHIKREGTRRDSDCLGDYYCLSCWNKQSFIERQIVHAKINKKLINQIREMKCLKKLEQLVI